MTNGKLRGHHLSNLANYLFDGRLPQEHPMNRDKYGEENIRRTKEFYDFIINNPQTTIVLVETVDTVCESECQYRLARDDCESPKLSAEDREELGVYGLELGSVTCGQILDKLREFREAYVFDFGGSPKKIHSYRMLKMLKILEISSK